MRAPYLEVTYRRGRAIAAYLYLPRKAGAKVERTTDAGHGTRVDFDDEGAPMGIEITAPAATSTTELDALLVKLGLQPLGGDDWAPLRAA